jgi:hypothetical protein
MAFTITSTAFQNEGTIPRQYTCDGKDVSPPLAWTDAPKGTVAYALIVDDPDAPRGTWVHWVLYDVPPNVSRLPENVPKSGELKDMPGAIQGRNDFKRGGYGGPCPPPGSAHRYYFKLYALASTTGLAPGASKQDVERAIGGHIVATAQLMGTYARE